METYIIIPAKNVGWFNKMVLIRLNDGEDITIRPRGVKGHSIVVINRGGWIGAREFKDDVPKPKTLKENLNGEIKT